MASSTKLRMQSIVLGGVALLVIAVLIGGGFGNALATAGLIALLVGGAAVAGRARWAGIATRRTAIAVAGAGLVALVVGANIATPTEPTSSSEAAEKSSAAASPSDDEAAEKSLAQAETEEGP